MTDFDEWISSKRYALFKKCIETRELDYFTSLLRPEMRIEKKENITGFVLSIIGFCASEKSITNNNRYILNCMRRTGAQDLLRVCIKNRCLKWLNYQIGCINSENMTEEKLKTWIRETITDIEDGIDSPQTDIWREDSDFENVSKDHEEGESGVFLERFTVPIDSEECFIEDWILRERVRCLNESDIYPCHIFKSKELREIYFRKVTILYGGNGSGKSTLLNLIAEKLKLKRIAPYNDSDLFKEYVNACSYRLGDDDEGIQYKIPNSSRIITSDDIFDYMLAVQNANETGQ